MLTTVNKAPENAVYVLDNNQGWISLLRHSGEEIDIVNAARVSFGKMKTDFDDKDKKLLDFLIKEEHFAPLEHETMTFLVHCPLFVRGQWHRHRTMSYNEISRRYTEVNLEFYIPANYRLQSTDNKQSSLDGKYVIDNSKAENAIKEITEEAINIYEYLLEIGVCREQARSVLPQNMFTTFYCTANLRNILHFLRLRMDSHAQYEIRQYANAMHDILKEIYPSVIAAFDEGLIN